MSDDATDAATDEITDAQTHTSDATASDATAGAETQEEVIEAATEAMSAKVAAPDLDPDAVTVTINGRQVPGRKGELIIAAADRSGDYIPRFCYHPRMSPVGMCRQCLVEVEGPRGPQLVVSCMTPVADGQVVHTETPTVKKAQQGIIEMLLANHPLDCPVCDKGGECPLQDQAFSHGPGESRFVEEKRHFEKPIPISDLVLLDRERCILCDRCTRFADEVAGDALIHFTQRGNNTQVLTFPDQPFSSYFSGNTVQICPVGALTSTSYRFKARPWDLERTESTCTTCSVGCRIVVESSRDDIVRYSGVDSDAVNWGWLCDRGRYNFQSVSSDERLSHPLVRTDKGLRQTTWHAALDAAATLITDAIASGGPGSVAIIGGARGTNEDAHAWSLLADALGITQVEAQLADGLDPVVFALSQATIDEAANAATVILLGPDLKEELPVLHLRLRDAAVKKRSRIVEFSPKRTGLSDVVWKSVQHVPGTQADVVRSELADPANAAQLASGPVVVVVGRGNLAEHPGHTIDALAEVLAAAPHATVLPVLRRGNVRGAVQAGLSFEGGPEQILTKAADGGIGCLILLGADPLADVPDSSLARRALARAGSIISIDTFLSVSTNEAHVVLPAAGFGEKNGSTTNIEGRVSSVSQKVTEHGTSRPDWMIAVELAAALGHELDVDSLDGLQASLSESLPAFAPATPAAISHATDGVVLARPTRSANVVLPTGRAPQANPLNSYDYRLVVSRKLYDQAAGTIMSPTLAALAPTAAIHLHPLDLERLGATSGASVKITSPTASVVMPVQADPAVHRGTAWSGWNLPDSVIGELIDVTASVVDVRVESL
jgi:NADH-quinone oxidoreductase subunit G